MGFYFEFNNRNGRDVAPPGSVKVRYYRMLLLVILLIYNILLNITSLMQPIGFWSNFAAPKPNHHGK